MRRSAPGSRQRPGRDSTGVLRGATPVIDTGVAVGDVFREEAGRLTARLAELLSKLFPAHAEVLGPESALAAVERLAAALSGYHLWHAVRAALLRALGRDLEARPSERRALELTHNPAEQSLLRRRLSSQC